MQQSVIVKAVVKLGVLMPSHRIGAVLAGVIASGRVESDRELAVMAALKMCRADYRGRPLSAVVGLLSACSPAELEQLARDIHPVLCGLELQKWSGEDGAYGYIAQNSQGRGQATICLAFDHCGAEIPLAEHLRLSA